jgi:hypothetical protein
MERHTSKPFGVALAELLRESDFTTSTGNPNWNAFARQLDGFHYETLRKAIAGERTVTVPLMEEVARALSIKPDYFAEYRIEQARRLFDVREVGFESALAEFDRWAQDRAADLARSKKKRR